MNGRSENGIVVDDYQQKWIIHFTDSTSSQRRRLQCNPSFEQTWTVLLVCLLSLAALCVNSWILVNITSLRPQAHTNSEIQRQKKNQAKTLDDEDYMQRNSYTRLQVKQNQQRTRRDDVTTRHQPSIRPSSRTASPSACRSTVRLQDINDKYRHNHWQVQNIDDDTELVVYSAFYDNRPIVGPLPWLRILGLVRAPLPSQLRPKFVCYVWNW
jgi:hypothetical protein